VPGPYNLDALGSIYDLYSPGIYRYAMRLLGDETLAEDCVADTFSRFLKVLRLGQGPEDHCRLICTALLTTGSLTDTDGKRHLW